MDLLIDKRADLKGHTNSFNQFTLISTTDISVITVFRFQLTARLQTKIYSNRKVQITR